MKKFCIGLMVLSLVGFTVIPSYSCAPSDNAGQSDKGDSGNGSTDANDNGNDSDSNDSGNNSTGDSGDKGGSRSSGNDTGKAEVGNEGNGNGPSDPCWDVYLNMPVPCTKR